ncbi:PREDICTED: zinc finger CCCH-type with G patch domain-containing protein-like, partial [Rhagoletis zephyria]|uniref:zinc finger CCCH-type with G patch domain-containing protein-like n=1 Tax=Rhagoletis zephyria TaxID=28612 RepID=UPI0008112654
MSVPAEEEEEVVFLGKVENEDEEQTLTEQLEQQQAQLDVINEQLEVDPKSSNTNSATSSSFGEWERYTSGIGSKLLLKMGYTSGTGLGSRAQGILNPIESYVFPPGHSLDACFTLKAESERKKLDIEEVMKEKKKERRLEAKRAKQYEKAVEKSREKAENNSVFRLLDDMFHSGSSSASASTSASSSFGSSKKQKVKSEPSRNQTKNLDAKSLALSAFKVDEELKKAEAELR